MLVSACGAPGTAALLRALRENGERGVRLVGTDMSERAVGRLLCDAFRLVPPGSDPAFADAMLDVCAAEGVDVALPQSSFDLAGLAAARERFEVPVLVSSPETIRRSNDKAECYALLHRIGVPAPAFRRVRGAAAVAEAARELGYPERPVCFKPVFGSGSRGFRVLDPSVDRAYQLLHERPGSVAMRLEEAIELLPEDGGPDLLVMELAERIVRELEIEHFFNIQLVGEHVIEVNPRISTVVYQDDLNLPYLGVKRALGEVTDEELTALRARVRPGRTALRYFDQVEWDAPA